MRHCLLLLVGLGAASPGHAGIMQFATRTAFHAAAGSLASEGFEHCRRATIVFTGPLDAAHPGPACGVGTLITGVRLSDAGAPGDQSLYIAAPHYSANRSSAIGQNGPAADALALDFATPTRAVGFDVFQNFGGGAQLGRAASFGIDLWSADTRLGHFTIGVPSGRGAFFGAISDGAPITRAEINNPLAYDLVDNIAFAPTRSALVPSGAAPAPEPGAIALLALGSGLLATVRRR